MVLEFLPNLGFIHEKKNGSSFVSTVVNNKEVIIM